MLALVLAPRPILIEGTITDDQGNALNGVYACVYFLRPETSLFGGSREDRYTGSKLEETVDSSFRFEGKGDRVYVTFGKKGYAPQRLPLGRGDDKYNLIRRDLRIVMKELTPEELEKRLFRAFYEWGSNDNIVRYKGEKYPTDEEKLERLRKTYGLEKSEMTDLFVKAIRDYLSGKETNPENQTLQDRRRFTDAIYHLEYYPPPQQEFLDLIRRATVELPDSADIIMKGYKKAYPDAEPPDAK